MSEEGKEEKSEEPKSPMEKMREKMKEEQGKRTPERGSSPKPPGSELGGMMQKMMSSRGGSQQNQAMMKTMKGLRADMKDIKEYLKKILDAMEE